MDYRFDGDGLGRRMIAAGYVTHGRRAHPGPAPNYRAMSRQIGLSDVAIRGYVLGRRMPSAATLASLADALGCDAMDLLIPVIEEVAL